MMKWLLTFLSSFFVISCKYKISTYSALVPKQQLNSVNLDRIKKQEANGPDAYKVALISDTHNYYQQLDELIKVINRRGPYSFVMITGDITNLGLLEEFDSSRSYFNKLKFPYLVAVGNHDLLANGEIIFQKMFGPTNIEFTYKGAHFFLINNNNWESRQNAPDMEWLESALLSSESTYKIILGHVPFSDQERFTPDEVGEFERLLIEQKVSYFFNGHNHHPSVSNFGETILITIGSPVKRSYFEFTVSPGGLSHQKISF